MDTTQIQEATAAEAQQLSPYGLPLLYHYTSQEVLISIAERKELWFTHIHYMNDASEYNHAVALITKVLKEEYGIEADEEINYEIQHSYFGDVYSFSLTQKGDQLSQWRGYCPNGGYSIRFDDEQLNDMIKNNKLYIDKCLYEEKDQIDLIYNKIVGLTPSEYNNRFTIPEVEPTGTTPEEIEEQRQIIEMENRNFQGKLDRQIYEYKMEVFQRAMRYAPLIKHKAFREEEEWRIVAFSHGRSGFRPGKSFMIPYLKVNLVKEEDKKNERVMFPEIIIGPTPQMERAKKSCEMVIGRGKVTESEIPFRNW